MKRNNTLVLITDSYPFGFGEIFLDIEVNVLSRYFETIYIYSLAKERTHRRAIPSNAKVLEYSIPSLRQRIKYGIKAIFFKEIWKDFLTIRRRFKHKPTWLHFKILMADYMKAAHIACDLSQYIKAIPIDVNTTVFYSYWHDTKALALCILNMEMPINTIARGHGWDLDYLRHSPPYLAFKNFMIATLDKSISISNFGVHQLEDTSNELHHPKIFRSYLGTSNHLEPIFNKEVDSILICSCSSLIPLKRIDWIIKVIASLPFDSVQWVHFGDGPLKEELKNLANACKIRHEFLGEVNNQDILNFYSENYVDLFINLSTSEGIPVSIMEAQSSGIPVLTLHVGGCGEIVDNENGFLLPSTTQISEISKVIIDYLNLDTREHSKKRILSYESWKENFNAEKNYSQFADLILSQ